MSDTSLFPAIRSDLTATHHWSHVAPIPDALVIVDAGQRMLFVNEAAATLFGYTAEELLEQPLHLLLPQSFHAAHDALITQYLAAPLPRTMGVEGKVAGRHRNGREMSLAVSLNPLRSMGSRGVLCVIRDLSDHAEADQLKEAFLQLAAHTLQTPLTALRGNVDTLLRQTRSPDDPELAEWQQDALEEIRWATQRLETLSATLIDVTRIQAGHLDVHREMHDLVALVQRVAARVRHRAQTHPLHVRVPTYSLVALIDARLIEQALEHVVDNAMKYSAPEEEVEITLRRRPKHGDALIQVRDHGVGITRDQRERIFTRFGGHDNQAGLAGAGLSLYLCRQFIERHGGRIGVSPVRGPGASIWFTLPLLADTNGHRAPAPIRE